MAKKGSAVLEAAVRQALADLERLFSRPGSWIRGSMAQNRRGADVLVDDDEACKWCLVGGIHRVCGPAPRQVGGGYSFSSVVRDVVGSSIRVETGHHQGAMRWNDDLGRRSGRLAVLRVVRRARRRAGEFLRQLKYA